MNICLFTDTYLPDINGVATSVNSLYKLLTKNGHTVYVVTSTDKEETYVENNVVYIPGLVLKRFMVINLLMFIIQKLLSF